MFVFVLFPIDIIFQLFDHIKYGGVRIVISLKNFTWNSVEWYYMSTNLLIYGELGRPPLVIQIKQRMANFWIKLAQGKDSNLSVIMYRLLLNLNNNSEYESPWIKTVQNILLESGLSNILHFLTVINQKCINN